MCKTVRGIRPVDVAILSARASSRRLQTATGAGTTVDFTITAMPTRLGFADNAPAFASLSSSFQTAADSGSFLATLKAQSTAFSTVTGTAVTVSSMQVVVVYNPTPAPTLPPSPVPSVTRLEAVPTSSGFGLSITLDRTKTTAGEGAGGVVYCLATPVAPTAVGTVKTATTQSAQTAFAPSAAYPTTVSSTISGLDSLRTYGVYCYVETTLGEGSTLSQVLASSITQKTACCKGITFATKTSNVNPTAVFGFVKDLSKTPDVYTFFVQSAPSDTLTVTPLITAGAGTPPALLTKITTVPAVFTFTAQPSSSSVRLGKFFLSTSAPEVQGDFLISLTLSGASAGEFTPTPITALIKVLSSTSPLPAPALLSAAFSSNGQAVTITFDSATDQGGIVETSSNTWPCSQLFVFRSDAATSCSWSNSTSVSVEFGALSPTSTPTYLNVGDKVSLKANVLGPACDAAQPDCAKTSLKAAAASVTATAPARPALPVVVLIAPAVASRCANLTIDPTGSYGNGGRPYNEVRWRVKADSPSTSTAAFLEAYLNSFSERYEVSRTVLLQSKWLALSTYSITLSLTNFLGTTGVKTVVVATSTDSNLPRLSIQGPSYVTHQRAQLLSINSLAQFSACVDATAASSLRYSWTVQLSTATTEDKTLLSTSADPIKLLLPPYSLTVGLTYTVTVRATAVSQLPSEGDSSVTASATVFVAQGAVVAAIRGGSTRSNPVNKPLILDASLSKDTDVAPTATTPGLAYTWSCTVGSVEGYGSDCRILLPATSVATVPPYTLTVGIIYIFRVTVAPVVDDGRVSGASVSVTSVSADTAQLTILSAFSNFRPDTLLAVYGEISANFAVDATWSVIDDTKPFAGFAAAALTPPSQTFTQAEASVKISFPLSLAPHTFAPGRTYTFQLTAAPRGTADPTKATFAQIVLTAIRPPTSGACVATPTAGDALTTTFQLTSPGWTTDAANFPLSYAYAYQLSPTGSFLSISALSLTAAASTTLPAGLPALEYKVTVQSRAVDVYLSGATATVGVPVKMAASINVTRILSDALTTAFSSGDINLAFQTVNNVATSVNSVNCTHAPNCTAYHRDLCLSTPHTCGGCEAGYKGIVGDYNAPCTSSTSTAPALGTVGAVCKTGAECEYTVCDKGACAAPPLQCPTDTPSVTCSGAGRCAYSDPSGNTLKNCTILDSACTASCVCDAEYGGRDCSLGGGALSARDALRVQLCQALVSAATRQDRSPALLDTLTSSLQASFVPDEVLSVQAKRVCAEVLVVVANLTLNGYLRRSNFGTSTGLAAMLSLFTVKADRTVASGSTYPVELGVTALVQGVSRSMVGGQTAVTFATLNLQLSVLNRRSSTLAGASLTPPQTAAQERYGAVPPTFAISPGGLPSCVFEGGYAQLSVLSWASNPFANSRAVASPLLRVSSAARAPKAPKAPRAATSGATVGRDRALQLFLETIPSDPARAPVYYVTLQFSTTKSFTRTEGSRVNLTVPDCTLNDGNRYVPCGSCNVSTYTDFNVTFSCYDASKLCPSAGSGRAATAAGTVAAQTQARVGVGVGMVLMGQDEVPGDEDVHVTGYAYEEEGEEGEEGAKERDEEGDEERNEEGEEGEGGEEGGEQSIEQSGRRLQQTATPAATTAPQPAPVIFQTDDDGTATSAADVLTYGCLVRSLAAELASVLSANPFVGYNLTVLVFVGCLTGCMLVTFLYLRRWDAHDGLFQKYLEKERERAAVRLLAADLRSGGRGKGGYIDLGDLYQKHYGEGVTVRERVAARSSWRWWWRSKQYRSGYVESMSHPYDAYSEGREETEGRGVREGFEVDLHPTYDPLSLPHLDPHLDPQPHPDHDCDADVYSHIALTTAFVAKKFPGDVIYTHPHGNLLRTIFNEHAYTTIFAAAPLASSRTERFLELATDMLIALFISTLFFGVFYPSDQTCSSHTTKQSCLREGSKIQAGVGLCVWDRTAAGQQCSLRPPPTDTTFALVVALICSILGLPFRYVSQSSVISHQSSVISHQSSVISHQSSVIA